MLQEMLYAIVGPWGRAAIEWMLANPAIVGAALLIWMGMLYGGKAQLSRIESRTRSLVLEGARRHLQEDPYLTADLLYDRLYREWGQMVRRSALFITHRWELWPLPAIPAIVRERIGFTPEWLGQYVRAHGFEMGGPGPKPKPPRGETTKPVKHKK